MQILILILTLLLAAPAIAQNFPIRKGVLQTDLNAGGHYITNAAGITDAGGNPLAGISVAQGTNIVLETNGTVVTINATGGGSVPAGIITNGQSGVILRGLTLTNTSLIIESNGEDVACLLYTSPSPRD